MGIEIQNSTRAIKDFNTSIKDVNQEKKVIYLTFDDGPSILTDKVLDILKENDVKATFFIIGNQINGFEEVIKRTHNDGHSIGLHTYTHKFKRIYSSRDMFIKEMLDCRNEIYRLTGISPNIIRFPGGSSKRLTNSYLNTLHSYNFKIYDWNMVTSDGINSNTSPNRIYRDATEGNEKLSPIILLLHCDYMHKNSCKALPNIIKYYKEKGYEFKIISEDTPELYFPIKK
ncbi:MAG: polysaccharide deacetylase [Clostridium sp.]|nr:polysaccharide deacetylase [Clostridium sp.]